MKAFIVYDNDYKTGEKLCFIIAMKDYERDQDLFYLIDELKDEYYEKIEEDESFQEETCLENYIFDELEKRGYNFFGVAGEYDLSD